MLVEDSSLLTVSADWLVTVSDDVSGDASLLKSYEASVSVDKAFRWRPRLVSVCALWQFGQGFEDIS